MSGTCPVCGETDFGWGYCPACGHPNAEPSGDDDDEAADDDDDGEFADDVGWGP